MRGCGWRQPFWFGCDRAVVQVHALQSALFGLRVHGSLIIRRALLFIVQFDFTLSRALQGRELRYVTEHAPELHVYESLTKSEMWVALFRPPGTKPCESIRIIEMFNNL